MKNHVWKSLTALFSVLVFLTLPFALRADVLLVDRFDQELNTQIWSPSDAAAVYVKDGVAVLDQAGSGGDWVGLDGQEIFPDCVIYYKWTIVEYSGTGDTGGYLRKDPVLPGGYIMRWGYGTVSLRDSQDHAPQNAWDPFPGASSPLPANSFNFELKAALVSPDIRIQIFDLDANNLIADWEVNDDWYLSGSLRFDCYKFGIVNIDNVIVGTPDMEETIFSEKFDSETLEAAVEADDKLITTWSKIKSQ